jgi:lactoylglutathione lyase
MKIQDTFVDAELIPFTIELKVADIEKTLDFYTNILGFELLRKNSTGKFAVVSFNGATMMIIEIPGLPEPRFPALEIRFLLEDIKTYHDEVVTRGGQVSKPLTVQPYGLTTFFVENPDGIALKFAQVTK